MTKLNKHHERNADLTCKAILDAAEETFAHAGFSGARIDAIAERSGYNKSLIFHYFTDKLGLYRAVIFRMRDSMTCDIEKTMKEFLAVSEEQITREFVEKVLLKTAEYSFDFMIRHVSKCKMLTWEAAEGWKSFRQVISPGHEVLPAFARLSEILCIARRKGLLRSDIDIDFMLAVTIVLPMSFLASIPRFAYLIPGRDWEAAEVSNQAGKEFAKLLVRGVLADHSSEQ